MPLYSDGVLDEVKNAVSIVSVISEYVALRKRGRNHVARCPFHNEKTPSFNVNEDRQIFRCFGCGLGGDVFKFIMEIEHLSFPEAVRFIAERHGIRLPVAERYTPAEGEPGTDADSLRELMRETAVLFHRCLLETEEGRTGLDYLLGRGLRKETIERFQLGYSLGEGDALIRRMLKKGIPLSALEACGLAKRSEDGQRCYDTFRGRVMFPIYDVRGRVIAFGGRALGDKQPKYLNSPETRIYNKSHHLFGLSQSREGIKKFDFAILVEGYMDFIVPFQYGIENLVASLGTSLTQQQVRLLGRYTRDVVVSYDPDSAGQSAAQRSLDLFLEEDFRVKVLRLPDGQDPDVFVRQAGADGYRDRLRDAVPYLDFVFNKAIEACGDPDNPRNKVQVLNAILPYLAKLPNAIERSEYVFRFARRLGLEDQQLLAELKRAAQNKKGRIAGASVSPAATMKFAEKRFLQLLLENTELQSQVLPRCALQDFAGLATEPIFSAMLEGFQKQEISTYEGLQRRFSGRAEENLLVEMQMEEVPETVSRETADTIYDTLRAMRLATYKQKILSKISEAVQRKDEESLNRLIEQRTLVDRELVSLSRR
jgi:DNA primase